MFDTRIPGPGTSGPHEFVERSRMAELGSIIGAGRSTPGPLLGVTMQIAQAESEPVCALPGCGRTRDDPIHWPPERPQG